MDPGPVVHALAHPRGTGPEPAPRSEAISVHNGFSFVKKKKKKKLMWDTTAP